MQYTGNGSKISLGLRGVGCARQEIHNAEPPPCSVWIPDHSEFSGCPAVFPSSWAVGAGPGGIPERRFNKL